VFGEQIISKGLSQSLNQNVYDFYICKTSKAECLQEYSNPLTLEILQIVMQNVILEIMVFTECIMSL
jgi:hypothetical protein